MPSGIPARFTEALRTIGLTAESYHVDSNPPIWGLALQREGADVVVIEQTPRAHDYSQDGRYHVRLRRSTVLQSGAPMRTPSLHSHRRQRDAIAEYLRRQYGIH